MGQVIAVHILSNNLFIFNRYLFIMSLAEKTESFTVTNRDPIINNENSFSSKEKETRKIYFKKYFVEFAENTTAHGFGQIVISKVLPIRVFWIFVLIACHVVVCIHVRRSVVRYMDKPISTRVTLERDTSAIFPAIVICNKNMIKKDKYAELWKHAEKHFTSYFDESKKNTLDKSYIKDVDLADWDEIKTKPTITLDTEEQIHVALAEAAKELGKKIHEYSNPLHEMIHKCKWKREYNCESSHYWNRFWHWKYGSCYVFNSGFKHNGVEKPVLNVSRSGDDSALEIVLYINQTQYSLNGSDTVGIRFYISDQGGYYSPHEKGYSLSPGFSHGVAIRKKLIQRIDPFDNKSCIKEDHSRHSAFHQHYIDYNIEFCRKKCISQTQVDKCGCVSYYLTRFAPDSTICKFRNRDCIHGVDKEVLNRNIPCIKECHFPCKEKLFPVDISSLLYPSIPKAKTYQQVTKPGEEFLKVDIFLRDFLVEVWTDQVNYMIEDLMADIGGQLGLFSGYSVLTMIEFIFFAFFIIGQGMYMCWSK